MIRSTHRRVFRCAASLFATSLALPLLADGLPLTTFQLPDFIGSGECAFCHTALSDTAGNDVSIDTHWRSTMMANSGKDPLWQAKVASEVQRNPALKAVIEDKCATCHLPMARTEAVTLGSPVGISGGGFLNPTNGYHAAAMDGVACALCHQVRAENLGQPGSFSGHYLIDTSTEPPNRIAYGPFTAPNLPQMQNRVGFTPAHGAHTTNSALCAVCHNLRTPFVDADGVVRGEFPEQMIYSEWQHSAYAGASLMARSCQDCHLPEAVGGVKLSSRGGPGLNLPLRSPFGRHHFVGGNTLLLDIFTNQLAPLALTASTANLTATRARVVAQLQTQTARLAIVAARVGADELALTLQLTNLAGHKLPSGFPSRRAWLHVWVAGTNGSVFFDSGRPLADGAIAGNDADTHPAACEPHWQEISQPGQVQIYEAIMQDTDGAITYTLLRGASYRKDNRLLPGGFDKATASTDVAPSADAATDPDFSGGTDRIVYRVPVGGRTGAFTVRAELLYQSLAHGFANDLIQETNSAVAAFQTLFNAANKTPIVIAQAEMVVDPALATRLGPLQVEPDGQVRLSVFAPLLSTNRVETSPDLVHWSTLATLVQTNHPTRFLDGPVINAPLRYYRLNLP
jgi:hypothetical protein